MSPEHDQNLPTATVESSSTEVAADIPRDGAAESQSAPPSSSASIATSVSSTGAGAAVARAPEPRSGETNWVERASAVPEPAEIASSVGATEQSSAPEVAEPAASADTAQITAAIQSVDSAETAVVIPAMTAGEAAAASESSDASESTQTMDQLMDQFSVPEPSQPKAKFSTGTCWR